MRIGKRRIEIGRQAEHHAERYLSQNGLRLLERNYRCRGGEIDLVMSEGQTLVFIEVRYRTHQSFGGAAASVDRRKQQRLIQAAQHYLQRQRSMDEPCRFDVVAIAPGKDGNPSLQWIKNAIELS